VSTKLVERAWDPESADSDGDQLDWSAVLSRFFPNRRRHNQAALSANQACKHWLVLRPRSGSVSKTEAETVLGSVG
jgi:hypothetical protein